MAMDKEQCCENPALVMECALDMGETMLRCGAEIPRAEDTVRRLLAACGWKIPSRESVRHTAVESWMYLRFCP